MNTWWRRIGWLVLLVYWTRPFSCVAALALEPRDPADPYRSVDPHGFGILGAMIGAVALMVPILWLLTGVDNSRAARRPTHQSVAVLVVIGTPTVLQLTYLRGAALGWVWPIVAASTLWFVLVAGLTLLNRRDMPSPHVRFARHPYIAWSVVGGIAALTAASLMLAFT